MEEIKTEIMKGKETVYEIGTWVGKEASGVFKNMNLIGWEGTKFLSRRSYRFPHLRQARRLPLFAPSL